MKLLLNYVEQQSAVVDGLETIADILVRYTEIERIYSRKDLSLIGPDLEAAIVKLYSGVLHFQVQAACQFDHNPFLRAIRNIGKFDDWTGLIRKIVALDDTCLKLLGVVNTSSWEKSFAEIIRKLERLQGCLSGDLSGYVDVMVSTRQH